MSAQKTNMSKKIQVKNKYLSPLPDTPIGCGGSAKHGGGAQRDGGSAVAAAQRLRRWRQRDSAMSAAAWRRQGGGGSAKRGGGSQRDGSSAVEAARRLLRWRQCDSAASTAARSAFGAANEATKN